VRVLISGAGGFVGGHLAVWLAERGHDVVALVRRTRSSILDTQKDIRIEHANLATETDALPAGPFDAIIHCAAAIPSAVPDDAELTRINVEGSRRLFTHAANSGARMIVFCSSMAVYGRITAEVVDRDTPIQEPNAYGRSKLVAEKLLAELDQAYRGLRALSIRLPGIIGPGSHDNFVSDTMACLAAGGTANVRNPDALFNNVVHIEDLVRFVDMLFSTLAAGHQVTTIAAADPLPVRDVVALLQTMAAPGAAVRYRQEGHSFLISSEHARTLGYRPATVRDAVQRFAAVCAAER
jgi:nucleoside-diphosphate-sugar epimerase